MDGRVGIRGQGLFYLADCLVKSADIVFQDVYVNLGQGGLIGDDFFYPEDDII